MSTLNGGPGNIVTNGLVLYLDAANRQSYISGSTIWKDISGNSYTGSFNGGPIFSNNGGGSIVLDGIDDFITIPNQLFNATTGSSFTIEIFFRRNSPTPEIFKGLYGIGNSGTTNARVWFFFDNNNNGSMVINYYTGPTSDRNITLSPQLLDTNFHQAVQIVDKSTLQMTGYFDGINKGSTSIESSSTSDTVFRIGRGSVNASIGIVRIYNRTLSQNEITQNYNATKGRYGL